MCWMQNLYDIFQLSLKCFGKCLANAWNAWNAYQYLAKSLEQQLPFIELHLYLSQWFFQHNGRWLGLVKIIFQFKEIEKLSTKINLIQIPANIIQHFHSRAYFWGKESIHNFPRNKRMRFSDFTRLTWN